MTIRVSDADVRGLIQVPSDVNPDVFIETANAIVEEHLVGAVTSEVLLNKIELYLAAHFTALTVERGSLIRTTAGEASEALQSIYAAGFKSTRFGQQAIALDYSGKLASLTQASLHMRARVELL